MCITALAINGTQEPYVVPMVTNPGPKGWGEGVWTFGPPPQTLHLYLLDEGARRVKRSAMLELQVPNKLTPP